MTGEAFHIDGLTITWYDLMIAGGVLAAIGIALIEAKRRGENTRHIVNMTLLVIPLGAVGARLYHVIDQWDYYMQNPGLIIGGRGLGIFGAIIGGALGLIIYTRWKELITLRWLDITAPALYWHRPSAGGVISLTRSFTAIPLTCPGLYISTRPTGSPAMKVTVIFIPCFSMNHCGTYSASPFLCCWVANCIIAYTTGIFSSFMLSTTASDAFFWKGLSLMSGCSGASRLPAGLPVWR